MFSLVYFALAVTLAAEFPVNHAHSPYRPNFIAASEWPVECRGRTYCHIKPSYYPDGIFEALLDPNSEANKVKSEIENRDGDDVACSANRHRYLRQIHLIIDYNNEIRFVMQTGKINYTLLVEECHVRGRIRTSQYLNRYILERQQVYCEEKKTWFLFPVLSLDGTTLESVAPRDGIPFSCSAQVMKN